MARRRQGADDRAQLLAAVPDLVVMIGPRWGWDVIEARRRMVDDLAAQGVVLSWDELQHERARRITCRELADG